LAEFERSLIRERTQAGLAAARRAGRTGGRPPKRFAYDYETLCHALSGVERALPNASTLSIFSST
jgi:DNA invertase Pin-like site-specific DNA recombinase